MSVYVDPTKPEPCVAEVDSVDQSELDSYKRALDALAIVSATDDEGRITYVNDGFVSISGYSPKELIGQTHAVIKSGRHPPAFFADMWRTIIRGAPWRGEICNRAKDGREYWVDSLIIPISHSDGSARRYLSVRFDVTHYKQAITDLEHAHAETERFLCEARETARDHADFLAAVSHEIRTPMNGVLGMAEILAASSLTEEQRRGLDVIRSSGKLLLSLLNDLLDVARVERGGLALETIPFDPANLVRNVIELQAAAAEASSTQLDIEFGQPRPRPRCGDPLRVQQVLHNVIGNALKFARNGRVVITARDDCAGSLVFTVSDDGIGMSREQLSHIFAPFSQADPSIARRFGGAGLGLSIVKGLVEMMRGTIDIRSKLGSGTCVEIRLPLQAAEDGNNDQT